MAYYAVKIRIPEDSRKEIIDLLGKKGSLGFIEDDRELTAYFPDSFDMQALSRDLDVISSVLDKAGLFPLSFNCTSVPDQDWNESWKKGFTAIDVGSRFTILPPWEKQNPDRINLIIDPGMAFGTGHHETTRSCLILMERYHARTGKDAFLDLGTGTGLLAIAASKLGWRRIVAADIDPLATAATRTNAGLNHVANIDIRDGGIKTIESGFDCIAANIISGVLVLLAPDIASHLKPGGIAILSGILSEQADEVIRAMEQSGLLLRETYHDDKWVSLVVARSLP